MYRAIVLCGLLLSLVACTKTISLQKEYAGPVPVTASEGAKVRLDLTMQRGDGTAYDSHIILVAQYRAIAESALKKGGYTLDPNAGLVVQVSLTASPDHDILYLEKHAAENLAVSLISLGTMCMDSTSVVDAQGRVVVKNAGTTLVDREIDMKDSITECFGGHTGKSLDQRPEWEVRHLEAEMNKHVASWLQIVLNAEKGGPTGSYLARAEPKIVAPPLPAAVQIPSSSQPITPDVATQPTSLTAAAEPMPPAIRPAPTMPIEPTVPMAPMSGTSPGNATISAPPTLSASATCCPPPATVQPAGLRTGSQVVVPSSAAKVPPLQEETVDLWRAERVADRFRILHRLAAEGLLEPQRYNAWARQNAGAFLLTTAPPPVAGLSHQIPTYEQIVDFWRAADSHIPVVAAAERETLFELLMPIDGPRAPVVRPPLEGAGMQRWVALLDRIRDEALLPAESIEAEKMAMEEARRHAGL